jgi:hypothetical protein
MQLEETTMTKFSEPQTVKTRDHGDVREKDLIPTREEVEQARKLVEEVRRGKPNQSKEDKNS